MLSTKTLLLYEQFEEARTEAIASSDHYNELSEDDPQRPVAWRRVMYQTETARRLLEEWLQAEDQSTAEQPLRDLTLV